MYDYLRLLEELVEIPNSRDDRTGTGTRSVFMRQIRFDLKKGFPLVTTKKLHTKSIIYELLWFLKGSSNIAYLKENGVSIWNEWADKQGELGPVYGKQWRAWQGANGCHTDQISDLIENLKKNPTSRRHLVTAWNPADVENMALPPCHYAFQCYVKEGTLSLAFHMRSVDVFLGLPFNIASYALLTHLLAAQTGMVADELIWTGGDVHLYDNHLEQAREQLTRKPNPLPSLILRNTRKNIDEYDYEDIEILNYEAHPHIRADVAV